MNGVNVILYCMEGQDIGLIREKILQRFPDANIVDILIEGNAKSDFFSRETVSRLAELLLKLKGNKIIAVFNLTLFGSEPATMIETIYSLYKDYGVKIYSIEEPWIYEMVDLPYIEDIVTWLKKVTIDKRREKQLEAWRKGKRRGRPPAVDERTVKKYVMKYRELAYRNKKALWLIMKAEGYQISYRRFLDKINKVLKEESKKDGDK